jgi:hypothetical protein
MFLRSLAFAFTLATTLAACTMNSGPYGSCGSAGCQAGYTCVEGVCRPVDAAASNDATDAIASDTSTADVTNDLVNEDADDVIASDADNDAGDAVTDADDASTDSAADVPVDAGPPCGHAGEMCCGNFCTAGLACDGTSTCVAFTREANECTRPSDCTGGQACGGPTTCTDHGCFVCEAPPGPAAFGDACVSPNDCATGVCRGQRCTIACDLGGTGNADCAALSPNYICTQLLFRTGTAPMTTIVALGTCRQSCARLADCTRAGETCLPQLNFATNTMDFICGVSSGTVPAGGPCDNGGQCQSLLCVPGALGDGGTGACTAPCVNDSDCPSAASHCVPISWTRPDGTGQSGHGCLP